MKRECRQVGKRQPLVGRILEDRKDGRINGKD